MWQFFSINETAARHFGTVSEQPKCFLVANVALLVGGDHFEETLLLFAV